MPLPSPPEAPRLDSGRSAWIVSRYADVHAALREPSFLQASAQGKTTSTANHIDRSERHAGLQTDLDRMSTALRRAQMISLARTIMSQAACRQPADTGVDIVKDFIHPWTTSVMLNLSGADPALEHRLRAIAGLVFHRRENDGSSSIQNSPGRSFSQRWFKWRRKNAEAYLDRLRDSGRMILSKSMFFGLAHTTPAFLAKAWLALLLHPDQMAKLLAEPHWMPSAAEELLRYAGIVHTLYRRATRDVILGEAHIAKGDFIILNLESANRDPAKFDSPHRLDITRQPGGNLGLGAGPHACLGAAIVRIAFSLTTPIFVEADPSIEANARVVWTADTSVRWPLVIHARLRKQPVEQVDFTGSLQDVGTGRAARKLS
jgi:cytochrome P450